MNEVKVGVPHISGVSHTKPAKNGTPYFSPKGQSLSKMILNKSKSVSNGKVRSQKIHLLSRKNFTKVNKILNKTRSIDESHFFLLPLSIFGVTLLPFKLLHGWIKPIYLKAINVRRLYPNYLCKAIQRSREKILFLE